MSVILDFGPDPAKTLRYRLAMFREQALRDAQQAARDRRERELREGYNERHKPEPPHAA